MHRSTIGSIKDTLTLPEGDDRPVFEAVFRSAAMGIALVDMDGHPVASNPALERMLGYSAEELRAMAFTEFTHPEDASADWDLFAELVAGDREHYEMHKRYLHRDGHIVWGRLTVSLIRQADGSPHYAVGMVEDVSERKRLEERYRALVEQIPGIVYTAEFGEAGRWRYVSPFATTLLGFSSAEFVDDPLLYWRQIHPDDRARVMDDEHRSRESSSSFSSEYRMITKSGETVWVYDVAAVVHDDDANAHYMQGVILDVTRRKEVEEQLAYSESTLRTIIESEPECVKQVARDGTLLAMNPAGVSMIEASSARDVVGNSVYDLVVPEDRDAFRALTEATFDGETGTLEFDIVGRRGTRRSMETHAAPLRDHGGNVVACLAVTRDVSGRKRAEADLQAALARTEELAASLSELNASKSELIQLLSHELFTPISVIQGVALTLAQQNPRIGAEQRRDLASGVERASHRLRRLVGNLSAAAQLDRDGVAIDTSTVSIGDLLSSMRDEFPEHAARLRLTEDPAALHASVPVDPELALRAIAVVVENALDMSEDAVEVDVASGDGKVVVTVADRGPGVPEPARTTIFDAFVQVDHGMTREHEGLGIGLYLARRIMWAHGGDIVLGARPGFGGVFELSFPTPS